MHTRMHITWLLAAVAILTFAAGGCQPRATLPTAGEQGTGDMPGLPAVTLGEGKKLQVIATTNLVGDVVSLVGGDRIALTTLMGVGVDPHSYVPTPAHTAAVHDAHVVFANGAGLEAFLEEMLDSAGGDAVEIDVSAGLELREAEDKEEHKGADPHVWFDVQNVIGWVETIQHTLSALDPANAEGYEASAGAYVRELEALDAWIVERVATIPQANLKFVTNHPAFGYFADRYGVEQVGAVYPISPASEPSAQDIAKLEGVIRTYGVPAVFTESTVNPKLADQVARDTGVKLIPLYTGSLGGPGSGAESYIALMRYDVNAIVDALQ